MTKIAQRGIVCIDGEFFYHHGKLKRGSVDSSNAYRIYSCVKEGGVEVGGNQIQQYCEMFGRDDELWFFGSGSGAYGDQPDGFKFRKKDDTRNFHAISIHETMKKLKPDLLQSARNTDEPDFVEAWFVGAHVDVVGGATREGISLSAPVDSDRGKSFMYDIRVSHSEHNLQESRVAPPISRTLQPRRQNRDEEESRTSDISGHKVFLNRSNLFEKEVGIQDKSRTLFKEREKVSDVERLGFCGTAHRGVIIRPSVYFLSEV
ncbi:hypothetical protein N7533_002576 [Penicillium manginii]|uniref:uncharacterized protein n=1 Tax=Penicillium manginii TaxID=203109 RepID=UPI0025472C6A|nr:uncharacterized protein N7533_002576 [Penicillium manginii]KAJ5763895.1 hypothetical protein N7533_002576 [Penicillium manginii]